MYKSYYGLRDRPFDLSPNPRFLFLSKRHGEALAHLRYGLSGRPGLTVLYGEAGTGKTTLVRTALQQQAGDSKAAADVLHLSNPTLTRSEFYEYLAAGFGFTASAGQSKSQFLTELEISLRSRSEEGAILALVVDEAQSLPYELLEEIRLLTNVEAPSGQALTVALVGQPELAIRLEEDRLRQLKQRIALRFELTPLDLQETAAYIATRIRMAGGRPEQLFTRAAVAAIYEHARGIPRTISVICDNALVTGFASDVKPVGRDVVLGVCRDFELRPAAVSPAAPRLPPRPVEPRAVEPHAVEPRAAEPRAAEPPAGPTESKESKPLFSAFTRGRRFFTF